MIPDFEKYVSDFERDTKHIKYKKSGMFYSEAFIFVSFCRHYDIDIVLESGTCLGSSTEMIASSLNNVQLYTFDTEQEAGNRRIGKAMYEEVRNKLNKLNNITASVGNGCAKLPELIRNNPNKKIAALIDGPKDERANELARECLRSENVKFVAIHDQSLPQFESKSYCTQGNQKYRFLDESRENDGESHSSLLDKKIPLKGFPKGPGLCVYYK